MSRSLNKVTLIGNLGAEPEVRSTSNGGKVATLSLATGRQWTDAKGEKQEKTQWHRVVLWNNKGASLADVAEKFCKKGDKVYIEGEIEYRSWQDKDGQTKYTTEINAREMILLSGKGEGSSGGGFAAPSGSARAPAGAGAAKPKKEESFDDFPGAMDSEDDDLPF
jgi:single-strand DNA-binding protein